MKLSYEELINHQNMLLCTVAKLYTYQGSWNASFCKQEVITDFENFQKNECDFMSFSLDQLESLGFRWFNEKKNLLMIPLHLFYLIPDATEVTSVFLQRVVKKKDVINFDSRFGLVVYGFPWPEEVKP